MTIVIITNALIYQKIYENLPVTARVSICEEILSSKENLTRYIAGQIALNFSVQSSTLFQIYQILIYFQLYVIWTEDELKTIIECKK